MSSFDDNVCPITLEVIKHKITTHCGHVFDKSALEQYCGTLSKPCPLCRRPIDKLGNEEPNHRQLYCETTYRLNTRTRATYNYSPIYAARGIRLHSHESDDELN